MPRLPTAEQLGEGPSYRSGRTIATIDTSNVGKGLQALGNAAGNVSADIKEVQDKRRQEEDAVDLARAEAHATRGLLETERGLDNDPDYATYGTRYQEGSRKVVTDASGLIRNERLRSKWLAKADIDVARGEDRILTKADGVARAHRVVELDSSLDVHRNILADPNANDEQRATARRNLEAGIAVGEKTGLYSPADGQKKRDTLVHGAILNREVMRAETDPATALLDLGVVDRIIGVESGGRADAKNPNSSATGLGQFTAGTWIDTLKRNRPDLVAGRSRDELLALRTDPDLSRSMTAAHAADNAATLQAAGIAPTDGVVYLAHFAGVGGAEKLIKADPNASAESVLGAEAVKANPFLKGKTAADVVTWANKKMGGEATVAGRYVELTPEERFRVRETAISAWDKGKKEREAAQRFQAIVSGQKDFNPYDKEDRTLIDEAFEGQRASVRSMDPNVVSDLSQVATGLSYVPSPVAEELSDMSMNGTPDEKAFAFQSSSAILANAPNAFDKADGGTNLVDRSRDFEAMTRSGLSPAKAVERLDLMAAPDYQARKAAGKETKEFKDFVKARTSSELADLFDDTWLPGTPAIGSSDAERDAVTADYKRLAEYHYLRTGSADLAVNAAKIDMQRAYGVSRVTGSARVMRFPPEKFYPQVNGSTDYIQGQLQKAVFDSAGEALPPESITLQPIRQTDEDVKAGRNPGYAVIYTREKDGQEIMETVPGMVFRADPKQAISELTAEREAAFRAGETDADGVYATRKLRSEMRRKAIVGPGGTTKEFIRRRDAIIPTSVPEEPLEMPLTDALGNPVGLANAS